LDNAPPKGVDPLLEGFNPERASSPATRYELLVIAKHLQLLILATKAELLASAKGDKELAIRAAERFVKYEEDFARDLATLVIGDGVEELL
jgi:hypothetical protein